MSPIKKVNSIYNTSSYIEGEVSEQSLLTIYTSPDNKNWSRLNEEPINTNEQNKFIYELPEKLAKAIKVKIIATGDAEISGKNINIKGDAKVDIDAPGGKLSKAIAWQ